MGGGADSPKNTFTDTHTFTRELPQKYHDAATPEKRTAGALSQIDYRHTRHCVNCKEVCLCQRTMQRAL